MNKALEQFTMLGDDQVGAFTECMNHILGYGQSQWLIMNAPAGMGKSFTISALRSFLTLNSIEHVALAFTGRAASRIKGNTCHSLLYEPVLDSNGDLQRWERVSPTVLRDKVGSVVLVDESSMIPKDMHDELSSIGVPIIYIGDNAQLPPINPDKSEFNPMWSLTDSKHISLDKMRRFSEDSGIAKVASILREENRLMKLKKKDVRTIPKKSVFDPDFYDDHKIDMVACGTNKTRKRINTTIRINMGVINSDVPLVGERVVCLRNDVIDGRKISNGEIYEVIWQCPVGQDMHQFMLTEIDTKKQVTVNVLNETWDSEQTPKTARGKKVCSFAFGYCVTVHKIQGSTFNTVLFYDENVSFFLDQQKFRYTAVTRAAEMLYIAA